MIASNLTVDNARALPKGDEPGRVRGIEERY